MNLTSISNISVIINSKIGALRDDTHYTINEMEIWLNNIINQSHKESLIRKDRCEICTCLEIRFDGHHIGGRKHDFRQITSCIPCHDMLSLMQKKWDARWLKSNQSENLKQVFFLQGLADILILKSKKTENFLYENLGYSYTEIIFELLKRG
ncbi:MAG: hypothetical protein ACW9W4_05655 [Candidatus Nitrosopumilus sp. bin_7KS]